MLQTVDGDCIELLPTMGSGPIRSTNVDGVPAPIDVLASSNDLELWERCRMGASACCCSTRHLYADSEWNTYWLALGESQTLSFVYAAVGM